MLKYMSAFENGIHRNAHTQMKFIEKVELHK